MKATVINHFQDWKSEAQPYFGEFMNYLLENHGSD